MMSFAKLSLLAAACVVPLLAGPRHAAADGRPPLPPEAYAACESKASGDACVVDIHGTQLDGTCAPDMEGARLFCRLAHPPGPPPAPSQQACEGR